MSCVFCNTKKSQPEYRSDKGYSFCQCDVCGRYVVTESEIMRWQRNMLDKDIVAAYLYHNVRLFADERDPSYAFPSWTIRFKRLIQVELKAIWLLLKRTTGSRAWENISALTT